MELIHLESPRGRRFTAERLVRPVAAGDEGVELDEPPDELRIVLGDGLGPALAADHRLVEPPVQLRQVLVRAVVDVVVELCQTDAAVQADLGAPGQ